MSRASCGGDSTSSISRVLRRSISSVSSNRTSIQVSPSSVRKQIVGRATRLGLHRSLAPWKTEPAARDLVPHGVRATVPQAHKPGAQQVVAKLATARGLFAF